MRQLLDEAFELAKPGAEFVVTKTRDSGDNLRTQMSRIIEHAGVEPWPKVFQNLRATRATEVADQYGEARESKWIGHSRKIARKHYFQVTDDDYAKAAATENSLGKALRHPLHGGVR